MPPLEIETKHRVETHAPVEAWLAARGATLVEAREDADLYFNAPDRDFAATDEAFRIRRVGPRNCLTYKGPKRDTQTKTRTELEVAFAEGPDAAADLQAILQHLGYRPVTTVRKRRTVYHLPRRGRTVTVCLDDVPEVGRFVELELVAPEAEFAECRDLLLQLAVEMDLGPSERRSYLGLLLAARSTTAPS